MKKDLHPQYHQSTVTCVCGNSFKVGSTLKKINVEICSMCHPFYTGKQKLVDTAGMVDKFKDRMKKAKTMQDTALKTEMTAKKKKAKKKKATIAFCCSRRSSSMMPLSHVTRAATRYTSGLSWPSSAAGVYDGHSCPSFRCKPLRGHCTAPAPRSATSWQLSRSRIHQNSNEYCNWSEFCRVRLLNDSTIFPAHSG